MSSIWVDLLGAEVRYRGNKYRTRVIEAGNGPPLILIHGVGGHAEAYSRNVMRLAENFHVMAIDLVWHGMSSKPPFDGKTIETYADQVCDLMDSMGAAKAHVEGESLGGWIAVWMALNNRDRLDRIVLNTNAGVVFDTDKVDIRPNEGTNLLRERSLKAIANPTSETIRSRLEWLMASPDRVTDELVELRHVIYTHPETQKALTKVFEASFGGDQQKPYRIPEARLVEITTPTLVLWADKNPGAGDDVGRRTTELIAGSQYHCIRDAAHWPQWEKPEEHDRVVTDFLLGKKVS